MIKPEGVANVLQNKLHAVSVDYEDIGDKNEKVFEYSLDFNEYKTFSLLKTQTQEAADLAEIGLLIEQIEPTIHVSKTSVEARIRVIVTETVNRNKIENRNLDEFAKAT